MGWVKLDDAFATHPKVIGLSDEAFRLHIEAMCYAAQHRTDGSIPVAWFSHRSEAAAELVSAGVWEQQGAGPVIHDYTVYNPSRASSTARSQAATDAARMRWAYSDAEKVAYARIHGDGELALGSQKLGVREAFDLFYDHIYPRKAKRPLAFRAFVKALQKASLDEIMAGAQRYRDDPNREAGYTAHPSSWLNAERWADDPLPASKSNGKRPDGAAALMRKAQEEAERENV